MRASTQNGYEQKIRASMRALGVYKLQFEPLIRRLAELYFRQMKLMDAYEERGDFLLVSDKDGAGAIRHPFLTEYDKLSKQALELERELGLTPAALRRVNEAALKADADRPDALTEALSALRVI